MQATSLSGLHWTNFLCEAVMRQFSVSLWVQGPVAVVFAPRIAVDPTRAATGGPEDLLTSADRGTILLCWPLIRVACF